MEEQNIKIGKQPMSVFEIPSGYKKWVMPQKPQATGKAR